MGMEGWVEPSEGLLCALEEIGLGSKPSKDVESDKLERARQIAVVCEMTQVAF
jgi:hypothetical protein